MCKNTEYLFSRHFIHMHIILFILLIILIKFLPHFGVLFAFPLTAVFVAILAMIVAALGPWEFYKFKTTVDPRHLNKTSMLVTSGIYRYSRNPMYLSLVLFLFSEILWLGNWLGIVGIVIFVTYLNLGQIKREEAALAEKFGKTYLAYKQWVRRWI